MSYATLRLMAKTYSHFGMQMLADERAALDAMAARAGIGRSALVRRSLALCAELTNADLGALNALAHSQGVSASTLLRQLVQMAVSR